MQDQQHSNTVRVKLHQARIRSNFIKIHFRPASHGLWLSSLLPLAFLATIFRSKGVVKFDYELSAILLIGLFLQTLEAIFRIIQDSMTISYTIAIQLMPGLVTSTMIYAVLQQNVAFSIITGIFITQLYRFTYLQVLSSLPRSFTLGEASIVSQAIVIFLYNCFLRLPFIEESTTQMEDLNIVLQIGLIAVIAIILMTYYIPIFRYSIAFYLLMISTIVMVCIVPIRSQMAVVILFDFLFTDVERIVIVGIYICLLILMGLIVSWKVKKAQRASTRDRKAFHILICIVFVPGLIFQCQFLFVATVVILAIFLVLETARIIELYPVSQVLHESILTFIDEKDAGDVALTPIYLLVGCSAPLWIHNSPCDLTGSTSFELLPLLSGIISIGIGDTFASIVGSKFGRHKWWNREKSVEGTIAGILSQFLFIYVLHSLGYLPMSQRLIIISGIAVITNSLIEALTDQVDNLVLPLVTYIILTYK